MPPTTAVSFVHWPGPKPDDLAESMQRWSSPTPLAFVNCQRAQFGSSQQAAAQIWAVIPGTPWRTPPRQSSPEAFAGQP